MDPETLTQAMRLGSQSPTELRGPTDLGRFGLGMKTAGFSQARVLTVASRVGGQKQQTRRWDRRSGAALGWCRALLGRRDDPSKGKRQDAMTLVGHLRRFEHPPVNREPDTRSNLAVRTVTDLDCLPSPTARSCAIALHGAVLQHCSFGQRSMTSGLDPRAWPTWPGRATCARPRICARHRLQ